MSIAHPGVFDDLLPYIRYEVMRAGGIDLGVVEVLREPVPDAFDAAVLRKGAARGAGALQGDVPRRRRGDHDAGREHVASGVSRDAGLAQGRPDRTPRPADDSFPLDRKWQRLSDRRPAAAVAAGDGRALPARAAADRLRGARRRRADVRRRA